MRLDSLVVSFPAWLLPALPVSDVRGNARGGRPLARDGVPLSLLARRRIALGLTQHQVAERLGIARETVSRLENRVAYRSRKDLRVERSRARLNALYLRLERA